MPFSRNSAMVAGLILAAGRSTRMGQPKALLCQPESGETFLAHLVAVSREAGLNPVFVVGRTGDAELRSASDAAGARIVVNADADAGQLSSVVAGLAAADAAGADAIVLLPVDVPFVTKRVLSVLLRAAEPDEVAIVRAVHDGRHGHPVLFKRSVFAELRAADPAIGAKAVVRSDPSRVRDVEVDEPGVTLDIDTPEDYQRAFGRKL